MKQNRKSGGGSEAESPTDKYSKINSLKLIFLVRGQEALYNSDADGYSDKNHKEMAWERIYRSLFPRYDTLSSNIKETISVNVRRRWKTLRNAIAREVKKNATVENYIRKKESPVIAELEFLIPHIKSAHCAKLADELGLRDCYGTVNETDEQEYDDDYNEMVDLTEEQQDIKPFSIKTDKDEPSDTVPQEALYPTVQLNTMDDAVSIVSRPETRSSTSAAAWRNNIDSMGMANNTAAVPTSTGTAATTGTKTNWRSQYCTVVQCKEGEFVNPQLLCTNPDGEENNTEDGLNHSHVKMPSPIIVSVKKRPRSSGNELMTPTNDVNSGDTASNDGTEIQSKIVRLLTNLERRETREHRAEQDAQDEDRMFLMSLVSDLRRVPAAKKMLLKAEIAMAIARAVPP